MNLLLQFLQSSKQEQNYVSHNSYTQVLLQVQYYILWLESTNTATIVPSPREVQIEIVDDKEPLLHNLSLAESMSLIKFSRLTFSLGSGTFGGTSKYKHRQA